MWEASRHQGIGAKGSLIMIIHKLHLYSLCCMTKETASLALSSDIAKWGFSDQLYTKTTVFDTPLRD